LVLSQPLFRNTKVRALKNNDETDFNSSNHLAALTSEAVKSTLRQPKRFKMSCRHSLFKTWPKNLPEFCRLTGQLRMPWLIKVPKITGIFASLRRLHRLGDVKAPRRYLVEFPKMAHKHDSSWIIRTKSKKSAPVQLHLTQWSTRSGGAKIMKLILLTIEEINVTFQSDWSQPIFQKPRCFVQWPNTVKTPLIAG